MKTNLYIQANKEFNVKDIEKMVKSELKANKISTKSIQDLNVYIKPEENMCYYVCSFVDGTDEITGKFEI